MENVKDGFENRKKRARDIVDNCISIYTASVVKSIVPFVSVNWNETHTKIAHLLSQAALEFGGVSLKACQFMALRNDLPAPYRMAFAQCFESGTLQSNILHVKKQLGPVISKISELSVTPDFSASVAQVHYCIFENKNAVAKILHPGVRLTYDFDLQVMAELGLHVNQYNEAKGAAVMLSAISEKLHTLKESELNLMLEARNQEKIYAYFAEQNFLVLVPKVFSFDENYLVMERMKGRSASHYIQRMTQGGQGFSDVLNSDQRVIVYQAYGHMIFKLRFVQSDPHPGNILLLDNGSLALLDYGQCIEVTDQVYGSLIEFIKMAPLDTYSFENKENTKNWLATIGIKVKLNDAVNTAKLLFFSDGHGVFPLSDEIDTSMVPFVIIILYLSRFERNVGSLRIQHNMRDMVDLFAIFRCWQQFIQKN